MYNIPCGVNMTMIREAISSRMRELSLNPQSNPPVNTTWYKGWIFPTLKVYFAIGFFQQCDSAISSE